MCRIIVAVAVSLTLFVCPASGQVSPKTETTNRAKTAHRTQPTKETPRAVLLLRRHVSRVNWDEAPFSDVLDWLKAQGREVGIVNIRPRWRAMRVEGVDMDSVVTLEMADTTVKTVLEEVLDMLSDLDPIQYEAERNILRISTKSDFDSRLRTQVYNLSDLAKRIADFGSSPQVTIGQGNASGARGQGAVERLLNSSGGSDADAEQNPDVRYKQIMSWVRAAIEPNSWTDNGGLGTMAVFEGQLVVHNSRTVHEQLARGLNPGE
jgi:hypothetical protein